MEVDVKIVRRVLHTFDQEHKILKLKLVHQREKVERY